MVRRSLARGGGRYVEKSPKTKASARTVPLPASMSGLVRRVLAERQSGHSGPLFVGPETPRLTYHTSRRQLVRIADVAEVPDCTGWHVLRRTAATLALRAGLNLKDVQAILGHENPTLTAMSYIAARDNLALAEPLDALVRATSRPVA